jgi:hypothetical protein
MKAVRAPNQTLCGWVSPSMASALTQHSHRSDLPVGQMQEAGSCGADAIHVGGLSSLWQRHPSLQMQTQEKIVGPSGLSMRQT